MTANAMQQALHSEPIWFSRFLSRKPRSRPAASTPTQPCPAASVTDGPAEAKSGVDATCKPSDDPLALAPTKSASQTIKSKRSVRFLTHRKPSTSSLSARAAAAAAATAEEEPRKKTAAYVPRHAGSDFSQVAIPTTYQNSYASRYSPGAVDRRPFASTSMSTTPEDARQHAAARHAPTSILAAETGRAQEASSLHEQYVSDGLGLPAPRRHQHQQQKLHHAQSTPDFRAASSARFHAKYRDHQQQHAVQNAIFTVPENGRASRPSSAATATATITAAATADTGRALRKSSSAAPSTGHGTPRRLGRRTSSSSMSTAPGSAAGSTLGEHAAGMSSFGRMLSEYIKPAALSDGRHQLRMTR